MLVGSLIKLRPVGDTAPTVRIKSISVPDTEASTAQSTATTRPQILHDWAVLMPVLCAVQESRCANL